MIRGEDYNGVTGESTFPAATGSKQWQLEHAVRVLIPQAFNQEKFEEVIQQSETVGNTTSANSNAMVVDSENDDNGPQGTNAASEDDDYSSSEDPEPQTPIPLNPPPIQILPKKKNPQQ